MQHDDMGNDAKEFLELYAKAEKFAKAVAGLSGDAVIPAHNELRYAGHHFAEAIASDTQEDYEEGTRKATSHCERAMYDATEAGFIAVIDRVELFREQYKNIIIGDVVQDIESIYLLMDDIMEAMGQRRNKSVTVEQALEPHMELFNKGVAAWKRLKANRDDLNRKQEQKLSNFKRFVVTTIIAGSVLLVLLANFLLNLGVFN